MGRGRPCKRWREGITKIWNIPLYEANIQTRLSRPITMSRLSLKTERYIWEIRQDKTGQGIRQKDRDTSFVNYQILAMSGTFTESRWHLITIRQWPSLSMIMNWIKIPFILLRLNNDAWKHRVKNNWRVGSFFSFFFFVVVVSNAVALSHFSNGGYFFLNSCFICCGHFLFF